MLKICLNCDKQYLIVDYNKRRKFCSPSCSSIYNNKNRIIIPKPPTVIVCLVCSKVFHSENKCRKFCSRQCISKLSKAKAQLKIVTCPKCNGPTNCHSSGAKRKMCIDCRDKVTKVGKRTMKEMSYSKDPQNRYRKIRFHAHEVARRSLPPSGCSKCPYDKHVELAHIRAISSFPEDTILNVINNPSNLMWLCPNCHWEFDNL